MLVSQPNGFGDRAAPAKPALSGQASDHEFPRKDRAEAPWLLEGIQSLLKGSLRLQKVVCWL